jgi:hypothetical protein
MKYEKCKYEVLAAVAKNEKATTEELLQKVIEIAKGFKDEKNKLHVYEVVAMNTNTSDEQRKDCLEEALFSSYNSNKNNFDSSTNDLKDLGIQEADLEKAFNAMQYVRGGETLTDENKKTLKNTERWTNLIDAICHYLKKIVARGSCTTQKESKHNSNEVTNSFVNKIEAETNNQQIER